MAPVIRSSVLAVSAQALEGYGRFLLRLWDREASKEQYHGVLSTIRRAAEAPSGATTSSTTLYLGIGVGVGSAILVAIVVLLAQIVRKRQQHQRAMEGFRIDHTVPVRQTQSIGTVPRPVKAARHGTLAPFHAQAGWGALSSEEALHQPEVAVHVNKRKRLSKSLPKRFRQGSLPMKRLKHLSAIMESPRSRSAKSPSPVLPDNASAITRPQQAHRKVHIVSQLNHVEGADDVFTCPDSPKPNVLPSFAIRSPGMYGAAIANDEKPKPPRSVSVGALPVPVAENAKFGQTNQAGRPKLHTRSISLGAPQTLPPAGPVLPLPVIASCPMNTSSGNRQAVCISRMSTSSQESVNSSVLITSPILTMHGQNKPSQSPSVEDVVADDDSAQLRKGVNRQWQNPLITGPRPMEVVKSDPSSMAVHASVCSSTAHYCTDRHSLHRMSSASTESIGSDKNRLSVPHLATADRVSISRVSSSDSLQGAARIQKVTTPRRVSRHSSVSVNGSPAERKKSSALREKSSNIITPTRQPSNSTQDSGRSSNGNPFQWDQPMAKPSALKGSPNARKGHRRQNCVRISTLTPQVLGPPPSRPTSPSIMHGIEEESSDGELPERPRAAGLRYVSNQRLPRPISASSLANNLRVQTLRASLTPSSPTLSVWTAYQQEHLPSQGSSNSLGVAQTTRSNSRQSEHSSTCSIPRFPSPSKVTMSAVQRQQPVPEFYLSRPSTDEPDGLRSSPFALDFSSHEDLPSSPPLPVSKQKEYDPAWSSVAIPAPITGREYDPASPDWDVIGPERSSPFFAFATSTARDNSQTSYGAANDDAWSPPDSLSDTPPCSPKPMPVDAVDLCGRQTPSTRSTVAADKLTSANASTMMASMTTDASVGVAGFPGAPVLPPPTEPEPQTTPLPRRQRAVSNVTKLQPVRSSLPQPTPSNDNCMPPPLNCKVGPQGPRSEPAKSVLKNAMALRRMNSEVDHERWRESRRYTRLGREASPLLPWICSPDPNESCNDMFDFGFDHAGIGVALDAEAGAEEAACEKSALDEIDMADLDRCLDGAIAGFVAEPTVDVDATRSSSVWEDGEKFWDRQPEFTFTPSNPTYNTTPTKKTMPVQIALVTPMPKLTIPAPNSIAKTPKSLYDAEGFLKT